jgi:hypothetical protein
MVLAALAFFAVASSADEEAFNLKLNMLKINVELERARGAMIRNEIGPALRELGNLKKDVHDLLSNQSRIEALLPKEKRNRSYIALDAAKRIQENIEVIEDAFGENKNDLSHIKRRVAAQRAYTHIEIACFHCHNLVRDE